MSNLSRPGSVARINVTPVARLINVPDLNEVRRNMDDLFGRWFGDVPFTPFNASPGALQPAVDIWETPEAYMVNVAAPGIQKDDIDLEVTGDTITIKGERKPAAQDNNVIYHVQNIGYGRFSAAYTLPAHIDASKVKAEYVDGILTVTLPKMETAKTRTIKVNIAGE